MKTEAFEILGASENGPYVLTCEHASNRVPEPLAASAADAPWLETHWGYDPGAAEVTRTLHERSGSTAILSRFSRLVCDPNRAVDHPDWVRAEVEGHALSFNVGLDAAERERRQRLYHDPYHAAIDEALGARVARGGDVLLFSVHSYTPVYLGQVREMEAGVLFNDHEAVAERFADALREEGFVTALNEPYSGRTGMIFSAQRHGETHNVIYLELEVRQDLIGTPESARAVGHRVANALERLELRRESRTSE